MIKVKKYLFFVFVVALMLGVSACNGATTENLTTTANSSSDTEAPVIVVNQDPIVIETDSTLNVEDYITVTDNISDSSNITITVSDWGTYDQSVEGQYSIVVTAEDEAGNQSSATLTVTVKADILAPMLTGSVSEIHQLTGEVVDLTKGLTGVDNVDGTNVIFAVSDYGGYDKDVAGTYTIYIVALDSSGNKSVPFSRTVVVEESYARAEMVSPEGEIIRFKALYNPQVFNSNTGTGYNTAYNGEYVNVLSKEYFEWLLEYAPERVGSGVGWSIIAVTNSDDEIVYVRHWNSGEAYMEGDTLRSISATDWSTGSVRTWSETINDSVIPMSNARYSSGEFGLMLANLLQWVPDDGKIFMFLNWTTIGLDGDNNLVAIANTSDMARSMGANYIMNSDDDKDGIKDYALGKTLKLLNPELSNQSVRETFHSQNPFPIITIPSKRYINDSGIWKERYEQVVYLDNYSEENPYNPLDGVVANDGFGHDITDQITYKIYRFQTAQAVYGITTSIPITSSLWGDYVTAPWKLSENEVTLDSILTEANDGVRFVVQYTVSANGHTDVAYNIIRIEATSPDYIELYGETDTLYSKVMGIETRLEMNPDLLSFGPFDEADRGMIFTSDYYQTLTTKPVLTSGVAVVLDKYYNIQTIRFIYDTPFEITKDNHLITTDLLWDNTDLLANILIPNDGYLLIYPNGESDSIVKDALRAFYDYDHDGSTISVPDPKNGIVQVELPIKEVQELSTLIINGTPAQINVNGTDMNVEVISNDRVALIHNPALGGAGFRQGSGKAYLYDKDRYELYLQDPDIINSFTNIANNLGVPWFNNGVIMIFDEDGNFVKARLGVGAAAEVLADGSFLFGSDITNWDVTVYTVDNDNVHGMLKNILDDVPDNGYFIIFPNTSSTSMTRNMAIETVWNQDYPGGGAIVNALADPVPANVDTLGFDSATFTASYFASLDITVNYVATIVDKADKIQKPELTLNERILQWNANSEAASYDLYVDGVLFEAGVGTLSEDGLTYSLDLSTMSIEEGTYDLQVRAVSADETVAATSVLSLPVSFTVSRLDMPTNFTREDNIVSWDAVDGASSYYVSINDGDFVEVTTNQVVIPDEDLVNGVVVKVYATGSTTLFDSLVSEYTLDIEVIPMEMELGPYVVDVQEFIVSSWMRYINAGDIGAQFIPGFVVVHNAEDFLDLPDNTKIFSGGYAVVLDSDLTPKYIVDRWGHEWNPIDGWTTNAAGWDFGANLYVSYFRAYLAEGDTIVFASQYGTGLDEGTYRNVFGNALIYDLGTLTTDHRGVDLATAIDPLTVNIDLREKVLTSTISLGLNDLPVVQFDLPTWLNYIDPDGGNDVGGSNISGIILINGVNGILDLDDTQKIFAGGYAAVLDSDMNVKYIVDRWGHEWNPTDGWTTNAGGWTYGATLYASYFKPYLAEGDILILASQYSNGLPTGTYRNYFGNALILDLGTYTTDHRGVDLATAIDPSTVSITFKQTQYVIRIGNELLNYSSFTLENWMGSYAIDDPGAASIPELVILTDLTTIGNYADTDRIFSGGYAILLDSDMNVKYIVDRWGNEWNPTDGWSVNASGWSFGANVYVSYISSIVEEGDILILAGQYENGLATGASYRDVIGNQVFFDLGTAIYTGDHRNVNIADAIDPSTVVFELIELQ